MPRGDNTRCAACAHTSVTPSENYRAWFTLNRNSLPTRVSIRCQHLQVEVISVDVLEDEEVLEEFAHGHDEDKYV